MQAQPLQSFRLWKLSEEAIDDQSLLTIQLLARHFPRILERRIERCSLPELDAHKTSQMTETLGGFVIRPTLVEFQKERKCTRCNVGFGKCEVSDLGRIER